MSTDVSGVDVIIDEVAIERFADGDTSITLTRAERIAAVLMLHERGVGASLIGTRLHMNHTRVNQILAEHIKKEEAA